ncbi:MAG: hypothetical protein V3V61_05545 [Gammaproteobacteria bacterium]
MLSHKKSILAGICLFSWTTLAWAQTSSCYVKFMKAQCWTEQRVTLHFIEAIEFEGKDKITLPANKFSVRHKFKCDDYDTITFATNFAPPIWEGEEDSWYQSKQVFAVPKDQPTDEDWEISLCFPYDFSSVPDIPDSDLQACQCVPEEDTA